MNTNERKKTSTARAAICAGRSFSTLRPRRVFSHSMPLGALFGDYLPCGLARPGFHKSKLLSLHRIVVFEEVHDFIHHGGWKVPRVFEAGMTTRARSHRQHAVVPHPGTLALLFALFHLKDADHSAFDHHTHCRRRVEKD